MLVACPHCNNVLDPQDHHSGKTIACPYCQGMVLLPEIATPVSAVYSLSPRPQPRRSSPAAVAIGCLLSAVLLPAWCCSGFLASRQQAAPARAHTERAVYRQVERGHYRIAEVKEQPQIKQRLIQVLVVRGTEIGEIRAIHTEVQSQYRTAGKSLFVNYFWDDPYVDPVYGQQIGPLVASDEGRGSGLIWWGPDFGR